MDAYFKAPKPHVEVPPTIVDLPPHDVRKDVLKFKTSLFGNRYSETPLVLKASESLEKEPCSVVYLGKSYDGLPLLLEVNRSRSITGKVLSSLGASSEKDLHDSIKKPLRDLERAVQERSCVTGIYYNEAEGSSPNNLVQKLQDLVGSKKLAYYKTSNDVGCLIRRTLYSIIANENSTSSLNERGEGHAEALKDKHTEMHLGVPIGKEPSHPLSVLTYEGNVTLEQLYLENLTNVLPSTKFQCFAQDSDKYGSKRNAYQGKLSDRDLYLRALSNSSSVELLINRQEFATKVILPIARDVHSTMHVKGRVHTDIKPANILILDEGPKLIDVRGINSGSIAATYTPAWASPEQILGKQITSSSDVYALAMLALNLVNGEIYGEIKNFKMPSTGAIQVLDTEGVWIETSIGLDEKTRLAWRETLTRFLSFNPLKRPQDGKEFADEFEKLLKEYPLNGCKDITIAAQMGESNLKRVSLETKGINPNYLRDPKINVQTEDFPAWVLSDTYSTLS